MEPKLEDVLDAVLHQSCLCQCCIMLCTEVRPPKKHSEAIIRGKKYGFRWTSHCRDECRSDTSACTLNDAPETMDQDVVVTICRKR